MVPRGEVGLIFAGVGLCAGVIAEDLYSALVVVVMLTTFLAPPWLKALYEGERPGSSPENLPAPPSERGLDDGRSGEADT
jgi:Kef-type K+ transport system membrane component KefB